MKTIVQIKNNLSKYLFDDTEIINIKENCIEIGMPLKFIIADLNVDNVIIYENVTAPEDWIGNKYLFVNGEFSLNPNWVEPLEK